MAVKVNPPPILRMPSDFFNDPDKRAFFEQMKTILFQLWQRTGGSHDAVSGSQIVIIASGDLILDSSAFGGLIVSDASLEQIDIQLPPITEDHIGESIEVVVIDNTFNTVITPEGSATIVGDTSVTMNRQWMSISFTVVSPIVWVIAR